MTPARIRAILEDTDRARLETLAREAAQLTRQYFGRAIGLYTPLYLSNHCASHCVYCVFTAINKDHAHGNSRLMK